MQKHMLSKIAVATLFGVAACAVSAQNIAVVNGKPVPVQRMELLKQQIEERSGRELPAEMEAQLKEEVIAREIFMQEAARRGLDRTPEYKQNLEMARQTLLIRELFVNFEKTNPVTDAEIKAEYDKVAASNSGKEYRARHILVEKEDAAKAIIAQLKKGGKFEDIAKKSSKDPGSGANGGDLDWAPASNYVGEFGAALLSLEKGKMTETPVKTQFGYHIIRLDDVRDAQLPKFDDVKPQITEQLTQQKLVKYQEELRAKAKIE